MRRYLLFAGNNFHQPEGGWNDLVGFFDSEDEVFQYFARVSLEGIYYAWWHIVDRNTWEITRFGFEG